MNKNRKTKRISQKFNFFIIPIIFICIVILLLLAFFGIKNKVLEIKENHITRTSSFYKEELEKIILNFASISHLMAENPELVESINHLKRNEMNSFINAIFLEYNKSFESVFITDNNGKIIAHTNQDKIGINVKEREFWNGFLKDEDGHHIHIEKYPIKSDVSGNPVFVIGAPIQKEDYSDVHTEDYEKAHNNEHSEDTENSEEKSHLDVHKDAVGILCFEIDVIKLTKDYINRTFGKTGYALLYDKKSRVIAHPASQAIYMILPTLDEYDQSKKEDFFKYPYQGIYKYMAYTDLDILPWTIGITIEEKDLIQPAIDISIQLLVVGIIMMTGCILIIILLMKKVVSNPLKKITSVVNDLSNGVLADKKVKIISNDEIGVLSSDFDNFTENLKSIILTIKEVSNKSQKMGEDLSANTEKTSTEVTNMTYIINSLTEHFESLNENIKDSSTSVNKISDSIHKVVNQINEQATSVEEASASIEEMIASIKNIEQITKEKMTSIDKLVEVTKIGGERIKETNDTITSISESIDSMMEMINIINGISSQTNMLAMNAAIEAAHAGQAGKGFAVVADEIRKLAEDTGENSKSISNSLKETISRIENALKSSSETEKTFEQINDEVSQVSIALKEVTDGMIELSSGGNDILKTVSNMSSITINVKDYSNEMVQISQEVLKAMKEVKEFSEEVSMYVEKLSSGTKQIKTATEEVTELSTKNKSNINELNNIISQFKTGTTEIEDSNETQMALYKNL